MPDDTVTIEIPEAHYTLFDSARGGMAEVVVVNDALLAFAHTEIFPWHLRVELEAHVLAENRMPTPDESRLLFEIGDRIENTVLSGRTKYGGTNALFLAHSTWNALRVLRFQVHNAEITHSALRDLTNLESWARPWAYRIDKDPEWTNAAAIFAIFPAARGPNA